MQKETYRETSPGVTGEECIAIIQKNIGINIFYVIVDVVSDILCFISMRAPYRERSPIPCPIRL